jgi:hypothetical protein
MSSTACGASACTSSAAGKTACSACSPCIAKAADVNAYIAGYCSIAADAGRDTYAAVGISAASA